MAIVDGYWKAVALWRLGWLMIGVAFDGASFGAVVIAVGIGQGRIGRCFFPSVALAIAVSGDLGSVVQFFLCERCGGDS